MMTSLQIVLVILPSVHHWVYEIVNLDLVTRVLLLVNIRTVETELYNHRTDMGKPKDVMMGITYLEMDVQIVVPWSIVVMAIEI